MRTDLTALIPWTRSFASLEFFLKGMRPPLPHQSSGKTVVYERDGLEVAGGDAVRHGE